MSGAEATRSGQPGVRAPCPARRFWLRGLAGSAGAAGLGALAAPRRAAAHDSVGPIRRAEVAPRVTMITARGERLALSALVRPPVTAVQTMFTGCSAVCPIQGALFAQLQDELDALPAEAPAAPMRLLSISIDPLTDDPEALRAWLGRFGAGARWTAATPLPAELDRLLAYLNGRETRGEPHTTQVALFDASGRFVWRTGELPTAVSLIRLADEIARA